MESGSKSTKTSQNAWCLFWMFYFCSMKVFIVGYMASGKTRFGKRLAKELNIPFLDLDQVIFERTQRTAAHWIRESGEEKFRMMEKLCLLDCIEKEQFVLSTGGGTPCFFNNMEQMNKAGITLWLNIPLPQLVQRLSQFPGDRPMLDDFEGEDIRAHFESRLPYYSSAQITIQSPDIKKAVEAIEKTVK
jgi:shikimate kinase